EQEQEKVFEKFHQLERAQEPRSHSTPANRPRGTGLGLPISRGIVNHLGGKLWVEKGQRLGGACFVLELPMADGEHSSSN
ncbi:MAG: hypothetical protein GYB21_21175, partial [Oceanospirillales bacterium]|nr:hypothetical protein [Oceanospirillales bacterium]